MASKEEKKQGYANSISTRSSSRSGPARLSTSGKPPIRSAGKKRETPEFTMAQQSIDLLGMLQEKTRGNLTPEEAQFLENMLFDLRMLYVQVSKRQDAPKKE